MDDSVTRTTRSRSDLVCLTLKVGSTWEMVKRLASFENRSVSSYLRELIRKSFKKLEKKLTANASKK